MFLCVILKTSCGENSTGPFLDNVVVKKFTPVPATKRSTSCSKDNLITNCSFEDTETDENRLYFIKPKDFPGWKSLKGQPLELWTNGFNGVKASAGQNFLEMDCHDADTDGIYQMVKTEAGKKYVISFDVRARDAASMKTDDEAIVLEVNDKKTAHKGYHAKNADEWTTHSVTFVATSSETKITFRETTTESGDDSTGVRQTWTTAQYSSNVFSFCSLS